MEKSDVEKGNNSADTAWSRLQHSTVKLFIFIRFVLFYNSLLTCFTAIIVYALLSLIPFVFEEIESDDIEIATDEAIIATEYTAGLLLVCIAVAVPIVLALALDWRKVVNGSRMETNEWISSLLLVFSLIGPNFILYIYLSYTDDAYFWEEPDDPPKLAFFQYFLFNAQYIAIVGSMLCSMFGHTYFDFKAGSSAIRCFSVERRAIYFLLTSCLAQALEIISYSRGSAEEEVTFEKVFSWLSLIVSLLALLQLLMLIGRMLIVLVDQMIDWKFTSHYHMSDFFRLIALLLFVVAYLVISAAYGSYTRKPSERSDGESTALLLVQLVLIYFLTMIPQRAFMLDAKIKHEKLETRLNLIRYVSHEMRTPLNTASMGLTMVCSEMADLLRHVNALASTASTSRPNGSSSRRSADHSFQLAACEPVLSAAPGEEGEAPPALPASFTVKAGVEEAEQKDQNEQQQQSHVYPAQHMQQLPPLHKSGKQLSATGKSDSDRESTTVAGSAFGPSASYSTPVSASQDPHGAIANNAAASAAAAGGAYSPYTLASMFGWTARDFAEAMQNVAASQAVLEDMTDTLQQVNESCKVAISTLDDLLTFDKLDEKKLLIELDEVNPWEFLKLASKPFEINARHANVDFDIQCGKEATGWMDRYVMKVDQFKLGQVMRNLMSNALKFTPEEGKVTVRIDMITKAPPRTATTSSMRIAAAAMATAGHNSSSSTVHPARCVARLTVKDTGAGISLENQKKLFGQYVQFNAAQLQKGKGSGLGLWITKSIVEMHCGVIGVVSEGEGRGSTFYVELPLYPSRSAPLIPSALNPEVSPRCRVDSFNELDAFHEPGGQDGPGSALLGSALGGRSGSGSTGMVFVGSGSGKGDSSADEGALNQYDPSYELSGLGSHSGSSDSKVASEKTKVKPVKRFGKKGFAAFSDTFFVRPIQRATGAGGGGGGGGGSGGEGNGGRAGSAADMYAVGSSWKGSVISSKGSGSGKVVAYSHSSGDSDGFGGGGASGGGGSAGTHGRMMQQMVDDDNSRGSMIYSLASNSITPPPGGTGVVTSVRFDDMHQLEDIEHLHISAVSRDQHEYLLGGAFIPAMAGGKGAKGRNGGKVGKNVGGVSGSGGSAGRGAIGGAGAMGTSDAGADGMVSSVGSFLNNTVAVWDRSSSMSCDPFEGERRTNERVLCVPRYQHVPRASETGVRTFSSGIAASSSAGSSSPKQYSPSIAVGGGGGGGGASPSGIKPYGSESSSPSTSPVVSRMLRKPAPLNLSGGTAAAGIARAVSGAGGGGGRAPDTITEELDEDLSSLKGGYTPTSTHSNRSNHSSVASVRTPVPSRKGDCLSPVPKVIPEAADSYDGGVCDGLSLLGDEYGGEGEGEGEGALAGEITSGLTGGMQSAQTGSQPSTTRSTDEAKHSASAASLPPMSASMEYGSYPTRGPSSSCVGAAGAGSTGADSARVGPAASWDTGLRFLVVDDAVTNRKMSSKLLRSRGHSVEEARDGGECVELVTGYSSRSLASSMRSNSGLLLPASSASSRVDDVNDSLRRDTAVAELDNEDGTDGADCGVRDAATGEHKQQPNLAQSAQNRLADFDVVLLDDNMPNVSGPEAVQALRSQGFQGLVFGVTGDATQEAKERFMANGADAVFVKPLDVTALRSVIEKKKFQMK